jgi:hypothetical protein
MERWDWVVGLAGLEPPTRPLWSALAKGPSPRNAEVRGDEPKNRIIAIILADGVYAPDIDGHDRPFTPACMPSMLVTRRNLARSLD